MSPVQKIVWGCIDHEPDVNDLSSHLNALALLSKQPDKVVVIDNDGCQDVENAVRDFLRTAPIDCEYVDGRPNRGFNSGFNTLLRRVIVSNEFEYFASMSVRARPNYQWLNSALNTMSKNERAGAAATVQFSEEKQDIVYGTGHYYRDNGGLYSLGYGLRLPVLKEWFERSPGVHVWCPCSGAALYRIAPLKALCSCELWLDPHEFKSYNCNVLGFLLAEHGWEIAVAWDAISIKDLENSTSTSPKTAALRFNQELCRIEQLHAFWPDPERGNAIQKYLFDSRQAKIDSLDRRIIVTRAAGWHRARPFFKEAHDRLREHLRSSELYHAWSSLERRQTAQVI